jgi:hypothetical protein
MVLLCNDLVKGFGGRSLSYVILRNRRNIYSTFMLTSSFVGTSYIE